MRKLFSCIFLLIRSGAGSSLWGEPSTRLAGVPWLFSTYSVYGKKKEEEKEKEEEENKKASREKGMKEVVDVVGSRAAQLPLAWTVGPGTTGEDPQEEDSCVLPSTSAAHGASLKLSTRSVLVFLHGKDCIPRLKTSLLISSSG